MHPPRTADKNCEVMANRSPATVFPVCIINATNESL
jgi:hypothetical protein